MFFLTKIVLSTLIQISCFILKLILQMMSSLIRFRILIETSCDKQVPTLSDIRKFILQYPYDTVPTLPKWGNRYIFHDFFCVLLTYFGSGCKSATKKTIPQWLKDNSLTLWRLELGCFFLIQIPRQAGEWRGSWRVGPAHQKLFRRRNRGPGQGGSVLCTQQVGTVGPYLPM